MKSEESLKNTQEALLIALNKVDEHYYDKQKLMLALKKLIIVAEKDEIDKKKLDTALRSARNVIADIDKTIVKCECCY